MKMKFFAVPAHAPEGAEEELNRFLAGHRVLEIDRQVVQDSYWSICVTYLPGDGKAVPAKRGKIDYREVLPAAEFSVFARLRSLRKKMADEEGSPAYALFTNEQLAVMVRRRVTTAEELGQISGVGPSRVEKYGVAFLEILNDAIPALLSPPPSPSSTATEPPPSPPESSTDG